MPVPTPLSDGIPFSPRGTQDGSILFTKDDSILSAGNVSSIACTSICPGTESATSSVQKKTVGGYVVKRDASFQESSVYDSSVDSDDSADSNESGKRKIDELCTHTLIDNEMAIVINDQKKVLLRGLSTNQFLQNKSMSDENEEENDEGPHSVDMEKPALRLSVSVTADLNEDTTTALRALFSAAAGKNMKPHHSGLNRVSRHIFALDDLSLQVRQVSKKSSFSDTNAIWKQVTNLLTKSRPTKKFLHGVEVLAKSSQFAWFFIFVSVYILFGPDLRKMLSNNELDDQFLTLHTIIFFLFIAEFCLLVIAVESYAVTLASVLDLVALFSLLSDTWFLHNSDLGESRVLSVARLTRITRVARITKLVPRIMATLRAHRSVLLAKRLLLRRLWRAFQYLDTDRDGLISSFDLKCFYLALLNDCPSMQYREKAYLVTSDMQALLDSAPGGDLAAENWNALNFDQFSKVFLETSLGHDVLQYHLSDVKHDTGVWLLTAKVSDNSALKVCTGILILIIVMNLLDTPVSELSATQGLFHVYAMLLHEKARGSFTTEKICSIVEDYKAELKVLFLHMDGITWVDYGASSCPAVFHGDPFARIDDIMELSHLRVTEVIRTCLPRSEDSSCPRQSNVAVALVDMESEFKEMLGFSLLSTLCVTIIITVLIAAFSQGINTFIRTTLHPLRALADDMIAVASVDLVHLDADMPSTEKEPKLVEELVHLQKSFKSMRSAIRSWSSYVPPSVVQKLFSAGKEAMLGVVRTEASILFVDVEKFEDACSGMEPEEVINLLASYLEKIALVIGNNRGTLLEFIGDEVLAVFNTPNAVRRHVLAAVSSSLQVHQQIALLPPFTTKDGRTIYIRCRCGVHSAHILAGNVGSKDRMKYGLLGDGVNLTARLKGLNSRYNTQTIASEKVFGDKMSSLRAVFRPLDRVAVKGKTEPTTVYEILGFSKGMENSHVYKEVAKKHTEAFRLFYNRQFTEAKVLFTAIADDMEAITTRSRLSASQLDQPARQLRLRCAQNIANQPGPDWNGVEVLTKKTFQVVSDDDEQHSEQMFGEVYDDVPAEVRVHLNSSSSHTLCGRGGCGKLDLEAPEVEASVSSRWREKESERSANSFYDNVEINTLCSCAPRQGKVASGELAPSVKMKR